MSDYPALIDATLRPELAALAAVDLDAARQRVRAMQDDRMAFLRGSLGLCSTWQVQKSGLAGAWVWSPGEAHHNAFGTLAVGRPDADGVIRTTFDLCDADDEHPAPWRWDFVRLFAGVVLAKPEQRGTEFSALVSASLDGYVESLNAGSEITMSGGEARAEPSSLPVAITEALGEQDGGAEVRHASFVSARVQGEGDEARLRLGEVQKDLSARAFFLPALSSAWSDDARIQALDVARASTGGADWPGRRRWLALARERFGARGSRLRLFDISERPPSALARCLVTSPFGPAPGAAARLTVALGNDPFQRIIHGPAASYLVRTRCHARGMVPLESLSAEDLPRMARLWGWLLAGFHLRGLRGLKADVPERSRQLAIEAPAARRDIGRLAWEHAAFVEKAWAAFRKMAQSWESP